MVGGWSKDSSPCFAGRETRGSNIFGPSRQPRRVQWVAPQRYYSDSAQPSLGPARTGAEPLLMRARQVWAARGKRGLILPPPGRLDFFVLRSRASKRFRPVASSVTGLPPRRAARHFPTRCQMTGKSTDASWSVCQPFSFVKNRQQTVHDRDMERIICILHSYISMLMR